MQNCGLCELRANEAYCEMWTVDQCGLWTMWTVDKCELCGLCRLYTSVDCGLVRSMSISVDRVDSFFVSFQPVIMRAIFCTPYLQTLCNVHKHEGVL